MHLVSRTQTTIMCMVSVLVCVSTGGHAGTIAVTEFMVSPNAGSSLEWVELFNYGATAVDVTNYDLGDNDNDGQPLASAVIPSGGYLIVARDKAAFETAWLGGTPDSRVIQLTNPAVPGPGVTGGFILSGSNDEVTLLDTSSTQIWDVAYLSTTSGAIAAGRAVFLADDDFSVINYGPKGSPVDLNGIDSHTGTLGYEGNNYTTDPLAYTSADGDMGSPLLGNYTPEPVSLMLMTVGISALLCRKH